MRPVSGPTGRAGLARASGAALVAVALHGCVALPPPPAGLAASAPAFVPERFFAGRTEGSGRLAVLTRRPRAVHVLGTGRVEPDGTLLLAQTVEQEGRPPARREWRIRRLSPGRYAGTLTDAAGPVTGEARGNMLRLRFAMRGGLAVEQRLYLTADGGTALNRMTVRKLGIVVAVLAETIRRVD